MAIYHFTSKYHIYDCLKFGITKGVLVRYTSSKPVLHLGIQWLTANPNPQKQTWAKNIDLGYDRTEYRIE